MMDTRDIRIKTQKLCDHLQETSENVNVLKQKRRQLEIELRQLQEKRYARKTRAEALERDVAAGLAAKKEMASIHTAFQTKMNCLQNEAKDASRNFDTALLVSDGFIDNFEGSVNEYCELYRDFAKCEMDDKHFMDTAKEMKMLLHSYEAKDSERKMKVEQTASDLSVLSKKCLPIDNLLDAKMLSLYYACFLFQKASDSM